ncbi:MAG TPA: 2-oxo acid dehydrogenase subunit E2 [Fimbriiglobus sp.]|nr:2-oxo acid dehydrogenase subunit E2 [Fimbriiglobus sp.]
MEFRLPELGVGIDSATVVSVLVKPGDAVAPGQNVVAVETDKAAVEVPVETAGTVEQVLVKPGDKLPVGAPILKLSAAGASKPDGQKPAPSKTAEQPKAQPQPPASPPPSDGGAKVEFTLPALGEGIDSATVVNVLVKPGDKVSAGQNVVAVETDKAAVEVPAEVAGTVETIHVKPGDKVPVGAPVLTLLASGGRESPVEGQKQGAVAPRTPQPEPPRDAPSGQTAQPATAAAAVAHPGAAGNGTKTLVAAGPATRRLARELGVSLADVTGSARGNRVTLDDVKTHVRARLENKPTGGGVPVGKTVADSFAHPPLPDFSKFGEVERKPVAQIRRKIAENLTVAWRTMPMVTQHDLADITDLEAGRKRIVEGLPKGAPKVTMTVLAVKAIVAALKEFPNFNASFDLNAGEMVFKKYFHVGIAVDTERGLVVPVIRDADKKSIRDLAAEVSALAEKARTGKLAIDEMRGGTFTITNLGGIGGTAFTPIVNYPEVAILGLSRSSLQPVVRDGQVVPRLMMPMSLTYDHRAIDGADGARFTTRLAQLFSDPIRLLMES